MPRQKPRARKGKETMIGRVRADVETFPDSTSPQRAARLKIDLQRVYRLVGVVRKEHGPKPKEKPGQDKPTAVWKDPVARKGTKQLEKDMETICSIGIDRVKKILELLEE